MAVIDKEYKTTSILIIQIDNSRSFVVRAQKNFDCALHIKSNNHSSQVGMSLIYANSGDYIEALEWAQIAKAGNHDHQIIQLLIGFLAQMQNNYTLAINALRNADAAPYYHKLAQVDIWEGHVEAAINNYHHAILIDPLFDQAYHDLGTLYYNQGQFLLALGVFKSKLEINPDKNTYIGLGKTYESLGDLENAISNYSKAAELGELWDGYLAVADIYLGQEYFDDAKNWYLRGLEAFPDTWYINVKLGNVELKLGEYENAYQYFATALDRAQGSPIAKYWMGIWYYSTGKYKVARVWIENAINMGMEQDFHTYLILGNSNFYLDDCQPALKYYRLALGLKSENIHQSMISMLKTRIEELDQTCIKDLE